MLDYIMNRSKRLLNFKQASGTGYMHKRPTKGSYSQTKLEIARTPGLKMNPLEATTCKFLFIQFLSFKRINDQTYTRKCI